MFVQIESVRRPSKRKRSPSVEREHERENIPVATRSASKGSRVLSFQVPRISQAQKKLLILWQVLPLDHLSSWNLL